jgi:hypothetical protein
LPCDFLAFAHRADVEIADQSIFSFIQSKYHQSARSRGFFDTEKSRVEPAPNPFVPDKMLTMCPE